MAWKCYENNYPHDFVDKWIKEFLERVLTKIAVSTVPKKDLIIVLPYLGSLSLPICPRINRVMKNEPPYRNLRIVFWTKCKLIIFSHLYKIQDFLNSDIAYKFKWCGCNAI